MERRPWQQRDDRRLIVELVAAVVAKGYMLTWRQISSDTKLASDSCYRKRIKRSIDELARVVIAELHKGGNGALAQKIEDDLKRRIGLRRTKSENPHRSKEQLLTELVAAVIAKGRMLTGYEIDCDPTLAASSTYSRKFEGGLGQLTRDVIARLQASGYDKLAAEIDVDLEQRLATAVNYLRHRKKGST